MSETHTTQTGAEINLRAYPPGSDLAMRAGCACAVLDNARGAGVLGGLTADDGAPLYWIASDCPLHATTAPDGGGAP